MRGERLVEFLRDKNIRDLAFKTKYFKVKSTEFASDFDVFCALCDSFSLFAGHSIRKNFMTVLESSIENIDFLRLSSIEYQKALWQCVFYEDFELSNDEIESETAFQINCEELYIKGRSACLSELADLSRDSIFDVLEGTLAQICARGVEMIDFDARNLNYSRPDDFHAQESYKQENGKDVFSLWLLCRVFMKLGLKLRLTVNSVLEAEKILDLLSSVKLAPQIYIRFNILARNEYQNLSEFIFKNGKKNISLELYFSKEIDKDILIEKLKELFAVIPIACMSMTLNTAESLCEILDEIFESSAKIDEREVLINSLSAVK